MSNGPILVTGSIRSGTTWVGRTLATAPGVALIHEPFNLDHPTGVFTHRWSTQYTFLTGEAAESGPVARSLSDTLNFWYRPWSHLRNYESPTRTIGLIRDLPRFWFRRHVSRPRPLLKDPIALFSAEWLFERFDMDVVITIRHPAAFAWSYRRIAEPNRFTDLLCQEQLMEGPLQAFRLEVERAARSNDPIYQASILWRVLNATASGYRDRHPEWVMIRHEDLSIDPQRNFSELFARLDLSFGERTRRFIGRTTRKTNPTESPGGKLHHLRRNSRDNVNVWRRRLLPEEVRRIRILTADVADRFYAPSTWS
ncbi:MAG TPA: sulfotransferase [Acidimicrobiia bacterium]|nr:sulfotransferase [Acidimicrobiia bacterium]